MDEPLERWITEMVAKGTFQTRDDAIEFCVGATRAFCEVNQLNQETIKDAKKRALEQTGPGPRVEIPLVFPLKWTSEINNWIRKTGAPPPNIARPRLLG